MWQCVIDKVLVCGIIISTKKSGGSMQQLDLFTTEKIPPKTCAFTGHRTLGKGVTRKRVQDIIETLVKEGITTFYCGMARGFRYENRCSLSQCGCRRNQVGGYCRRPFLRDYRAGFNGERCVNQINVDDRCQHIL